MAETKLVFSNITENSSGLLESKMNTLWNGIRKSEINNAGPSMIRTNAIYKDEEIFKNSLLSIQIEGIHICTGISVGIGYGFTTANCAIKVKMNLPDYDGDRVRVYYGDTLKCDGLWTTVNGVSFKKEKEMLTLDESYEKRKYDYGFIRVSFSSRPRGEVCHHQLHTIT